MQLSLSPSISTNINIHIQMKSPTFAGLTVAPYISVSEENFLCTDELIPASKRKTTGSFTLLLYWKSKISLDM